MPLQSSTYPGCGVRVHGPQAASSEARSSASTFPSPLRSQTHGRASDNGAQGPQAASRVARSIPSTTRLPSKSPVAPPPTVAVIAYP